MCPICFVFWNERVVFGVCGVPAYLPDEREIWENRIQLYFCRFGNIVCHRYFTQSFEWKAINANR